MIHLGIDVGSTTVKVVVTDRTGRLLDYDYRYGCGQPARTLLEMLNDLGQHWQLDQVAGAGMTGSGGEALALLLGALRVNELVAQARALEIDFPHARTVIEMGGQDSKLLFLEPENGALRLADFAMNSLCAAGTGSFLDQQAGLLGLSLEAFSKLALQAQQPARVAGRCAVFAKSDLVHLGQQGIPLADIVAGLCLAVARNLRATLGKGKPFHPPVVFQGGVARNVGMIWAFEQVLGLVSGALLIPPHCTLMAALGAALVAFHGSTPEFRGLAPLSEFVGARREPAVTLPPLRAAHLSASTSSPSQVKDLITGEATIAGDHLFRRETSKDKIVYLGVDVGSSSTKAVALDREGQWQADCYLPTAGEPLKTTRMAIDRILAQVGEDIHVAAVGVTGSGRYLVSKHLGIDRVYNEIVAQARAAQAWDPQVETVFEIGGQDSKYISLCDGAVTEISLNKACAAGAGAFLEEQAGRLGLDVQSLGHLAMVASAPADLSERCTVFVEVDLIHHQQQGAEKANLAAGVAYAIARNYLAQVVHGRPIGKYILFQGGVALNPAVVAAFESLLKRSVIVPHHPELQGAFGAALLAREGVESIAATLPQRGGCADVSGEQETHPDLYAERENLLLGCWREDLSSHGRPRLGIPRVLTFYDLLPYWSRFFRELDWDVVLSPPTTPQLAASAGAEASTEACFPVKLVFGHVLTLLGEGVDHILLPSVVNRADSLPAQAQSYQCPYIQAVPHMVEAACALSGRSVPLLHPPIHFLWPGVLKRELRAFARQLEMPVSRVMAAHRAAEQEQRDFKRSWQQRGEEVLASLKPGQVAAVLVGRTYSAADPCLNANLPAKLQSLRILAIPQDLLPLDQMDISGQVSNMFWHSGQYILAAAQVIRRDPRLQAIYLTHFGCGPDSFLLSFFRQAMGDKLFLELELDDHNGDAGLLTRLEAFLTTAQMLPSVTLKRQIISRCKPEMDHSESQSTHLPTSNLSDRRSPIPTTVYIPNVCDPAHVLAAAMRAHGLRAEVLSPSTGETLTVGRKLALGRECLPFYTLVGDIVQRARQPGFDSRGAYLVPTSAGPCRLGQFHDLLSHILGQIGLDELRVVAPSAENGYQYDGLGVPPLRVGRLAWQGLVGVSILEKFLHHHRPYEREAGSTESLYRDLFGDLLNAIEMGGGKRVEAVMSQAGQRFAHLPVDRTRDRPLIGLVGELYLRLNPFTNQELIRRVEALGGEVWLAPMSEWIYYANHFSRFSTAAEGRYGNLLRLYLIRRVLSYDENRLLAPVEESLKNAHEPTTVELLGAAQPYFHPVLRTEAPLTIGKAIDFVRHGVDGILNAMPFICMPGVIVASLAGRMRADLGNIPWLDISFDGLGGTNQQTRLEAFMHQVRKL